MFVKVFPRIRQSRPHFVTFRFLRAQESHMSHDDKLPKKYEIGYRRTPIDTRFRKGHSGNPKGKAPGHMNFKTELLSVLSERVGATDNGVRRLLPRQTIILRQLVNDAAKGDARAREQLF